MILAATGHRPHKMGNPRRGDLLAFAIIKIFHLKPNTVICGLANGWDLACGEAALKFGIPLWTVSPFAGHADRWHIHDRLRRDFLIDHADEHKELYADYQPAAYRWRNIWMVNNCQEVLALFNGTEGGTKNCMDYAKSQQRKIHNVWADWEKFNFHVDRHAPRTLA